MNRFAPYVFLRDLASRWDVLAFIVVIGLIVFLGETSRGLFAPLSQLDVTPLSLDPIHLPEYAARTTFRMLAGLFLSLVFTLTYATWAAKSERAGKLLVPILDILQSVPILGFISVTVVFFMSLAPGTGARRRVRGHLRHFHQPSLEHGLQLLSVAAHDSDRAHGSGRILPAVAVDALLAAGSAFRHAGAHLEHDDVHVGRLVLRRRLGIDQRRTHHRRIAGSRFLYCARHRTEKPRAPSAGRSPPC